MRRRIPVALGTTAVLALAGCGGAAGAAPSPEVVVLAAASLTDVLAEVGERFEAAREGTTVTLVPGASSTLAAQVVAGAPADVLVTASPATMRPVVAAGAVTGAPAVVARNRLELAVPAANPGGVTGLTDLAREDLRVALCAEQVPCGAAAVAALAAAGVTARPDTFERDARATLGKVVLGEVDVGLVYRTDVLSAGDAVTGIPLPAAAEAGTDYVAAALAGASRPEAARAFVGFLHTPDARAVLERAGFAVPDTARPVSPATSPPGASYPR